ncbi:hypothetical protein EB796_001003 [Bugula neritina]|uniref:Uncharacterized protein n=1 Tax=Bugula neritina TaxID=10212 RepID=A0A7J7KR65_BUGNE|nr:hypothetical protein EB796_001003 [Bugula neritina]
MYILGQVQDDLEQEVSDKGGRRQKPRACLQQYQIAIGYFLVFCTIPIGGRRRNASVDSSFSEGNRSSGKFSIALTQALGEQEQKMDLLASRRESLAAVDSVKRPIIGKADVDTESKFNLFRQTLWHWRSSLHLKNTLFTLVEAGCVALQHRFLQQAYIYLKFAHLITTKIKQKINPLTGEPLTDQTELLEGFWVSHSTKLVTLIALVSLLVFDHPYELGVNQQHMLLHLMARLLHMLTPVLCLDRPTDASAQLEVSRILSSLYHSQGTSKGSVVVQLLLDTSLGISQQTQDEFEVLICYGNIIHHYQQEAKFSALHRVVNKTNVFERELNLNEVDKTKKGLIRLAQFYLNLVKLHSSLCEGDSSGVSESVNKINGIVKEVPDKDGLNNLYFVPTLHQAALRELCHRPEDLGAAILSLQTVDDATYFTCLWEEFIAADIYEHNILASYVLYMLVKKEFSSPLEMQNSIVLMEALQPKELNTYWKVHVYAKVAMAAVLALEQTKNADSLRVLAAKMLNNLNSSCKSVPVFLTTYKKLQRALASWQKEGIILKDFIHIANVHKH